MGLRNSFDFTFDPLSGRIFATENGPGCDDEVNRIEGGFNYGWRPNYPCDDESAGGPDPQYNTIKPLWTNGTRCCQAPTGIAVYTATGTQWRNELFMAAYETPLTISASTRPTCSVGKRVEECPHDDGNRADGVVVH